MTYTLTISIPDEDLEEFEESIKQIKKRTGMNRSQILVRALRLDYERTLKQLGLTEERFHQRCQQPEQPQPQPHSQQQQAEQQQ